MTPCCNVPVSTVLLEFNAVAIGLQYMGWFDDDDLAQRWRPRFGVVALLLDLHR